MKMVVKKGNKLWIRIMVPVSLGIVFVIIIVTWFHISGQNLLIRKQIGHQNEILAESVEGSMYDALAVGNNEAVRKQFRKLSKKLSDVRIYVYDFNQSITFSTHAGTIGKSVGEVIGQQDLIRATKEMIRNGVAPPDPFEVKLGGEWYNTVLRPIMNESRCHHCHGKSRPVLGGITLCSSTKAAREAIFKKNLFAIITGALGLAAIMAIIYLFFARRINRRIGVLLDTADKVAQGNLDILEIDMREDEIGQVNLRLRHMVHSLRELTRICQAIAEGDFSHSVSIRSEADSLGKAVNQMLENLKLAKEDTEKKISYLNNIPTPVHVIDVNNNVQFINEAGARAVGVAAENCVGTKCYQLFRTDHCNPNLCQAAVALKKNCITTAVTVAHLPDKDVPVRYTGAPLHNEHGKVIGVIEYIVDISDETKIIEIAERIAQGDYSIEIEKRNEDDRLSEAINRMTRKLREITAENDRQNWLKTGIMSLNEQVRGEEDLANLCGKVIRFLCRFLEAKIGAIYVKDPDGYFILMGSYAYQRRKRLSCGFQEGEGLVGQAALEKQPIMVTEVPEDYICIQSGLGSAVPRAIMVVPLIFEHQVNGVVELGKFQEFTQLELTFLNQAAEHLAISINLAQSRSRLAALLEETQKQAEALRDREEMLQAANDGLEAQTAALMASEAKLRKQQDELQRTNRELEEQTEALRASEERLQLQQEELRQANEELEEQTQLLEEQKADIEKKNKELERAHQVIEEKARDLEISGKYKSEFLANMSHELRTPLNSILLLSKMIADNKPGNLTEKQIDFARTIYESGTDLLNLINEILDLAKVESGKMELFPEEVAIIDLVEELDRKTRPLAKEKGLEFSINTLDTLPENIVVDRQRLFQILKNFLSNALKFTEVGKITVTISRPDPSISLIRSDLNPATAIAFAVADTGIGVAEDKQSVIFEAFQQADGTTNRKYGGTGLGLSISRELARLLGGEIHLTSQLGKGSCFTLIIPQQAPAQEKKPEVRTRKADEKSSENQMNKPARLATIKPNLMDTDKRMVSDDRDQLRPGDKSILIIEDDPGFAKVLRDLAKEKGFKVLVAENGEVGIYYANYYRPSAIILDIGLPRIDGWAVMNQLKENPDTRHIPVHFISGLDKSLEAMKMGAIGYMTKPVTLEKMESVFKKIESILSASVKKLLLVEDNALQQKSAKELLSEEDIEITTVETGHEALEMIKTTHFDCMILDLGLPDMSGVELLKQIKDEEGLVEMPIIIYTGKELTPEEEVVIDEYARKVIIKGAKSPEKLLDETALFLHRVEASLPEEKRKMIRRVHDKEAILKGKTILLADDDMRNVFALTNILEDKGIRTVIAKDGQQAIDRLLKTPNVDLVLMDIMMPVMDGYETTRRIRKMDQFKDIPIIALTAKAMKGDRSKCIEAGANDYLAKPVDTDKLLSMLRVWLYK